MAISVQELGTIDKLQWYQADVTGTNETRTTVLKGKAPHGTLFDNDIFDSLSDGRVGTYGWYQGHVIRYGYGRQYDEIDITVVELTVNYNKSGYYSRFEAQARTESRPLEEKTTVIADDSKTPKDETYATWWNHKVVSAIEDDTITESEWKAITDGTRPDGFVSNSPRWVKSNQALKSGEFVILDARFPGVQSYGVPFKQVKERVFSKDESVVRNIVSAVGSLKAPRDSANQYYDTSTDGQDNSKWLVTSASYRKVIGWWEAELTYAFAKGGWLSRGAETDKSGVYPEFGSL